MLDHVRNHVLPGALALLPVRMDSLRARALLIAIGLQESRFEHRFQIGGPARGFWQFELIGVRGVLEHPATAAVARSVCERLIYSPTTGAVYAAIADNDVLAACFARLALWQHPDPLPGRDDPERAWNYYLAQWRPGKPHRRTWDAFYQQAWESVR